MQCDGHYFDSTDEFKWHPDATLQSLGETILALEQKHASTGLWLYVDPSKPEIPVLHEIHKSRWEALPTTT
ncbi:Hypothetical protein (Fragment) [Durusdinium trenchii]|uniref:Uncharacterized protein n=1 Tax=Durusdinium trenchii TaxID=1381693 RepID=A0ABP0KHS2_9DINO